MALANARVSMPVQAKKGEVIEIKTLIRHRMETGYRVDAVGKSIPRDIITKFKVTYAGDEVFLMDFTQGVAANPYVSFYVRADQAGELEFVWEQAGVTLAKVQKSLAIVG